MTSRKIAGALCEASFEVCAKTIIPPWIDGADDLPAKNAWAQVQVLRRQRAELIEIFPHKKADLDQQFDDAVMKLAVQVYEELFDLTP
jgi:hypothetical protein